MKKFVLLCLALALLLWGGLALADTVSYSAQVQADTAATYVDFGSTQVSDLATLERFLDQLPNLTKVDMFDTRMSQAWAAELTARYPRIEFGWTFRIPCTKSGSDFTHIIRTDATAFSTLHNNQSPVHSQAEFSVLQYCHHMLALDIGHNNVTDLSFLSGMPKLRVLIIGRNNQLEDISPLAHCPDLEYIEAFSCSIRSIAPLLNCTHLMDLNIPNNRITDITLLRQLTGLKRLWAFNYGWRSVDQDYVDSSVKAALRAALPNCEINWTQSGTGGSWRTYDGSDTGVKTPHYDVITRMFTADYAQTRKPPVYNADSYIPFEDSWPLEEDSAAPAAAGSSGTLLDILQTVQ